jgi:hypothetical protein
MESVSYGDLWRISKIPCFRISSVVLLGGGIPDSREIEKCKKTNRTECDLRKHMLEGHSDVYTKSSPDSLTHLVQSGRF